MLLLCIYRKPKDSQVFGSLSNSVQTKQEPRNIHSRVGMLLITCGEWVGSHVFGSSGKGVPPPGYQPLV